MSNARSIIEAENPKKAMRSMQKKTGKDRLEGWINRTFFAADRLLMKRPFLVHPDYALEGRFWYHRVHIDTHGPTVLTCVFTAGGQRFAHDTMEFHPVDGADDDMVNILNPVIEEVQWAATNPPENHTLEERRYWLEQKMSAVFTWAREQIEKLQNSRPGLWAI